MKNMLVADVTWRTAIIRVGIWINTLNEAGWRD